MTRLLCLFWLVLVAAPAAGDEGDEPPPAVGVTVQELAGARIVEAVLPGSALAAEPGAGGIAILLAPEGDADGPRSLYRFDPSGGGELTELARDLPAAADSLSHLDVDGDGRGELIVGEPGRIHLLGALEDPAGRRPRVLLEAPDLDLGRLVRQGLIRLDETFLPHPTVGRLATYRAGAGPTLTLVSEIDLPVTARRLRTGLQLSTPPVHRLERPGSGPPWLAVGPERQGNRRLLTTLIDPGAGEPGERRAEAWCQLSADEKVVESWYLSVDGLPVLVAAVLRADRIGILEKKKLRVFPLRTDRTRAGTRPALEIQTVTRHWFGLGVRVADFDRDGRGDLIVVQPDGLGAKKLAVEVYRGKGNGGFFLTPRRSVVVVPEAVWTFEDIDGDGVGDLVSVDDDRRLVVFRGLGASRKKAVLEKAPRWSFEAQPSTEAARGIVIEVGDDEEGDSDSDGVERHFIRPRVVDLDGDGRGEILLRSGIGGRSILRLFELRP